ncbi:MAG TPA: hypothetical protein VLT33_28945 [Labilithrix sp.]|nr:hypothetical protein [Labilithrix sp.]
MTTPITSTNAVPSTTTIDSPPTGLTADGVLTYCAARLNSLDAMIQSRFAEQQQRNAGLKEAGDLITKLSSWSFVAEGTGLKEDAKAGHQGMGADLAALYNKTNDPQVRQQIEKAFAIVTGKNMVMDGYGKAADFQLDPSKVTLDVNNIHAMTVEQWSGVVNGVKSVQDGLTKDSEMSMIQLQSVVSQRQLAIQMTTQLLQTMNESSKQVIGNIR